MKRFLKWYFIAPAALVGFALFAALGGWVVMQLWNWLAPPLFGWPSITLWQGLGLLVLCRILFGGFGFSGAGHSGGMSAKERRRMRRRMSERFCRSSVEGQESTAPTEASASETGE